MGTTERVERATHRLTDQLEWKLALENPTTLSLSEVSELVDDDRATAEAAMVVVRHQERRLEVRRRVGEPLRWTVQVVR